MLVFICCLAIIHLIFTKDHRNPLLRGVTLTMMVLTHCDPLYKLYTEDCDYDCGLLWHKCMTCETLKGTSQKR